MIIIWSTGFGFKLKADTEKRYASNLRYGIKKLFLSQFDQFEMIPVYFVNKFGHIMSDISILNACLHSLYNNDNLSMGTTVNDRCLCSIIECCEQFSVLIDDKRFYLWFKRLSVVMWLIDSYLLRCSEMRNNDNASQECKKSNGVHIYPKRIQCEWQNGHKTIEIQSCRLRINSHCRFDWCLPAVYFIARSLVGNFQKLWLLFVR